MKIKLTHILGILFVFVLLVAGNVWQYQNPEVVKVPADQTKIDSTAWVQQSTYMARQLLIDSLRAENEKLAEKIEQSQDKIANYTSIIGRLRIENDSLKNEPVNIADLFTFDTTVTRNTQPADLNVMDTTLTFQQTFSDSLFRVKSNVSFNWPYLDNELHLSQQRPINIDVVNTFNDDRSRMLTYVTSPDFDSLRYKSYTELQPKDELPKFWIGAGTGVAATLVGIILIN